MRWRPHQVMRFPISLPFWSKGKSWNDFSLNASKFILGNVEIRLTNGGSDFATKSWPASGSTKRIRTAMTRHGTRKSLVKSSADTFECRRANRTDWNDYPFRRYCIGYTVPKTAKRRIDSRPLIDSRRLTIMAFPSLAAKISDFCCCLRERLKRFDPRHRATIN